jgi:phage shock protein A
VIAVADGNEQVRRLEQEISELEEEVDRYRTATEDALQQLDCCIGYFVGSNKKGLAKSLGSNRSCIRKHLLKMPAQPLPESDGTDRE